MVTQELIEDVVRAERADIGDFFGINGSGLSLKVVYPHEEIDKLLGPFEMDEHFIDPAQVDSRADASVLVRGLFLNHIRMSLVHQFPEPSRAYYLSQIAPHCSGEDIAEFLGGQPENHAVTINAELLALRQDLVYNFSGVDHGAVEKVQLSKALIDQNSDKLPFLKKAGIAATALGVGVGGYGVYDEATPLIYVGTVMLLGALAAAGKAVWHGMQMEKYRCTEAFWANQILEDPDKGIDRRGLHSILQGDRKFLACFPSTDRSIAHRPYLQTLKGYGFSIQTRA